MSWQDQLNGDSVAWLLESEEPAIRHLALRDLLDRPADDPELIEARAAAHRQGPIPTILDAMHEEGHWVEPGAGYNPKYRSTVWSISLLAQAGAAAAEDERIRRACAYLLDHALTPDGRFSADGNRGSNIDCLHGNLSVALLDLGYDDPRLEAAFEWAARSVTGEGIAPASDREAAVRYYAAKCGPGFACGANNKLPCAWGAVKIMLAFSKWPAARCTPLIERAIRQGVDFLFSTDPAKADYPMGWNDKPNRSWWKFGFPVFYVTDVLQNVEALVGLGYGNDSRLANALDLIRSKQDGQGRWALDYDYTGKTWVDFGAKRQPNPWVTLRALRVLKAVG
jgi:hypothetical protein